MLHFLLAVSSTATPYQARGGQAGDEVSDWLAAEQELKRIEPAAGDKEMGRGRLPLSGVSLRKFSGHMKQQGPISLLRLAQHSAEPCEQACVLATGAPEVRSRLGGLWHRR